MKIILITILALPVFTAAFPRVMDWSGKPTVVFENKVEATLKKDLELKLPFALVTSAPDKFEFRVNSFDQLRLYSNGKLQILDFADNGFVPEVYFISGKLRVVSVFRGVQPSEDVLRIRTPFFDLKLNAVATLVIELNMKEPSVEVRVLEGLLPLQFFDYEKQVELKAGQKVKFQGQLSEDGQGIKYDYLLRNRKVPKGSLSEVEKFSVEDYLKAEKEAEKLEIARRKELQNKFEEKRLKQMKREANFLCKKPFGNKNDCAWWAEGEKCFRQRCNVNGQWGDKTQRPMTRDCGKDYRVTQCDY